MCITVRRWVLQNRDNAQPPFSVFFVLRAKKISVAAVATPRVTRFADFHFSKFGQRGLQSGPNPATQIFAGGVLKPFDIVEIVVVKLLK